VQSDVFQLGAITDELSPDVDRALEMALQFGLQYVEVHTLWGENLETLQNEDWARFRQAVDGCDLQVCCLASTAFLRCSLGGEGGFKASLGYPSIAGEYEDHLEALGRSLERAGELGAPLVRIFGFWRQGPTTEETYERIAERFQKPLRMAQSAGVRLAVETCPHTYLDWGGRAAKLVARLNSSWLGVLWDPAGAVRAGDLNYMDAYPKLAPWLAHVHAKDIRLDPGLERGRAYVPVGQGQIDWAGILGHLARDGYGGVVSLETHHLGADGTKETAAAASMKGLKGIYRDALSLQGGRRRVN
jgi:L-ribulose-5-phosphate 3-epimerase